MVVMINDDDDHQHITIRESGHRRRSYIPHEIWLEIISRMDIKTSIVSRAVCKRWRKIGSKQSEKLVTDPLYVPLCSLLLCIYGRMFRISYISLNTKQCTNIEWSEVAANEEEVDEKDEGKVGEDKEVNENDDDSGNVISSGYEKGLLADLRFDFSKISVSEEGFVVHGGLLLRTLDDGTSYIHNLATEQVFNVPKSPIVVESWFESYLRSERVGLIIQWPSKNLTRAHICRFQLIRFCRKARKLEFYSSALGEWKKQSLPWKIIKSEIYLASWNLVNYVAFHDAGQLSLYFLTNKDHGVALKFGNPPKYPKTNIFYFPLPGITKGGYDSIRISDCNSSLYLTYYKDTGVWIWKAVTNYDPDAWEWVALFEISSNARQLCKPVASDRLSKLVMDPDRQVVPLVAHPSSATVVVFFLVDSVIVAYDMDNDTFDHVTKLEDDAIIPLPLLYTFPFKPCLSSLLGDRGLKKHG